MADKTKREKINKKIGEGVTKQTPEVLQMLRDAFAVDATIEEACFYAGIAESTYYNWKQKDPELMEELERLRLTPILKARQTVATSLSDPDRAFRFLERKRSDEFATKNKTEHSGKIETADSTQSDALKALGAEYDAKLKAAIIEERRNRT